MVASYAPVLPPGRKVILPGRGCIFFREVQGDADAPTVLLLHGWTATADLNWFTAYPALTGRYHVLAPDHRGHGQGIPSPGRYSLEDCADDAAALLRGLGHGPVLAVGYSMGGAIAQLLAHRHPELVAGLVLAATSSHFAESHRERALFSALGVGCQVARAVPAGMASRTALRIMEGRAAGAHPAERWALEQVRRHDWRAVLRAGRAIGEFDSRPWLSEIAAPAAVLVTEQDTVVSPARQRELAGGIGAVEVRPIRGDHAVCVRKPERFVGNLVAALATVRDLGRHARHTSG